MPVNYPKLQLTGRRLINGNGKPATLRAVTDSGEPWNPGQTVIDTPAKVVQTGFDKKDTDGGWLIEAQDVAFLFSSEASPTIAHRLLIGGLDYAIVGVRTISPGPLTMLHKVQARA